MSAFENAFKGWASTVIGLFIVVAQMLHYLDIYHVPRIDEMSERTQWCIFAIGCLFGFVPRTKLEEWTGFAVKAVIKKFTKNEGAE